MTSSMRCNGRLHNGRSHVVSFLYAAVLFATGLTIGSWINVYLLDWGKVDVHLQVSSYDASNTSTVLRHLGLSWKQQLSFEYVVPNIVHFIWFADNNERQLTFINYISIRSAFQIHKPDSILLHCNYLPAGEWWQRLWREVPLTIIHREPPTHIHGQELANMHHRGDIAKIEVLVEYGGIYLDYDVIVVNSLNPLRRYDVTLGKEKPPKLIAGIMVARRNATFLRLLHESYRSNYRSWDWDYNCARLSYQLFLKRPDLLHVEPFKLTTPDWTDRDKLWNDVIDWRDLYVVHVMAHFEHSDEVYSPLNIRALNTTFGQLTRFIYYGSPKTIASL